MVWTSYNIKVFFISIMFLYVTFFLLIAPSLDTMRMFQTVSGTIETRGTRDHLAVILMTTHRFELMNEFGKI